MLCASEKKPQMNRPELRYLNNAEPYLEHVLAVWEKYFTSGDAFRAFFDSISSDEDRNLFLRVGSFYRYLVVEGRFLFKSEEWNRGMSYIDDTYKYIAIFSLIEALDSPGKYIDFYQWLQMKKKGTTLNFGEAPMKVLSRSYQEYKDGHGSRQAAVRFFSRLDQGDQLLIQDKLEIHDQKSSIKQLAQLLYDIRSQFVHQARLIISFSGTLTVGTVNKKIVINQLSMQDLQALFEHGFLKRFEQRRTHNKLRQSPRRASGANKSQERKST